MYTLVLTLHVLAAVLIIGPFALAAFSGHRAIRRDDADDTRDAARFMARFGAGSLLVALLGVGALAGSDRYTFRTPWVIISLTLYVVAMGVATGYTVPAMRKAAALIEASARRPAVPAAAVAGEPPAPIAGEGDTDDDDAPEPAGFASANAAADAGDTSDAVAANAATRERLSGIAGRVIGSGTLVLVLIALITILMVTRPFGR